MVDSENSAGSRNPDPTLLTTAALLREIAGLKELMEAKLDTQVVRGVEHFATVTAQMDGFRARLEARIMEEVRANDERHEGLKALLIERFEAINLRFRERDLRFDQSDRDHQKALEAALLSVSAATLKIETTFTKQIDAIQSAGDAARAAINERISELRDRTVGSEGRNKGMDAVIGWVVGAAGAMIAIIVGIMSLFRDVPVPPPVH